MFAQKELTLISPIGRDYLRELNYIDIHIEIRVIGILSQARKRLDIKVRAHTQTHIYDSRFYDNKQAQIANVKIDLKIK